MNMDIEGDTLFDSTSVLNELSTVKFAAKTDNDRTEYRKFHGNGSKTIRRPNFFIGVRLAGIEAEVNELQYSIKEKYEVITESPIDVSKCLTSSKKMHLTAFVLSLPEERLNDAVDLLQRFQERINDMFNIETSVISLDRVCLIKDKVIYISPNQDHNISKLKELLNEMYLSFYNEGFLLDHRPTEWIHNWLPHATIAKTSADRKTGRQISFTRPLITDFEYALRGREVQLTTIDLLEMSTIDEYGYYTSYASILFPCELTKQPPPP